MNRNLATQIKIERLNVSQEFGKSKFIAKVKKCLLVRNNFAHVVVQGTKEYKLPKDEGLVLHYREKCPANFCSNRNRKIDLVARKFDLWIWKSVDHVCKNVFQDGLCLE